ncbi:MAG: choice-of-anchor V domain-containing protein [Blastocatellia bacterium]
MNVTRLKLSTIVILSGLFFCFGWQGRQAQANQGGPPAGLTGAPGESDCLSSGCHTGNDVNSSLGTLTISGLPTAYRPDQEISFTLRLSQPNRLRFGFQITAIDAQGRKAGDLIVTDSTRTQKITTFVATGQRDYLYHTSAGTLPNGANESIWEMRWKAPSQTVGRVTFHASGNAANGNSALSGDFIYVTSASMQAGTALPSVASVSAASFAQGALAPESITAAFSSGGGLSQNVAVAATVPLPTTLDNTQLIVRDAFGIDRLAPLFFVSPGQINYLLPQGLFPGTATVFVRRNNNDVAQGSLSIESFAPSLFAANSNGQGVAAAVALRIRNGQQIFEPISRLENGVQIATPIDLGPEGDQVYLLLYGTGFRGILPPASIGVTIGGANVPVLGYAAVAGFAGLDQCNVGPLPQSLTGRGNLNIALTAGTKAANTVSVAVK